MSLTSLALLLGSACIHDVTHVALKRSRDRTAFVWWMLLWSGVLFVPVVVWGWQSIPPLGWVLMLASSVFEAGYFLAIAKAYQGADLSLVYPLARGLGPALLLVWSTLILREHITAWGIAGVLLIAVGLYATSLPRLGAWAEPLRSVSKEGPRWALLAGACISLYTAVDKVGVGLVQPMLYVYLIIWLGLVWLTPVTFRMVGWEGLKAEWRYSRLMTAVAGFTTLAAYAIVLFTMRLGTPASYAGSVREISVVLGAAYGVLVLKENSGATRLFGSALVAGGIGMIGLLG
jgi:drug/metabolite transporter (DMT)-like permease